MVTKTPTDSFTHESYPNVCGAPAIDRLVSPLAWQERRRRRTAPCSRASGAGCAGRRRADIGAARRDGAPCRTSRAVAPCRRASSCAVRQLRPWADPTRGSACRRGVHRRRRSFDTAGRRRRSRPSRRRASLDRRPALSLFLSAATPPVVMLVPAVVVFWISSNGCHEGCCGRVSGSLALPPGGNAVIAALTSVPKTVDRGRDP